MATNPFGFGPMGLPSKTSQAEDPATKKSRIDALAVQTQVPANVLLAFDERGDDIEAKASEISAWMRGGRKMEEVVPADVMGRAYDIADALYPREAAPPAEAAKPSLIKDFAKQVGGSLVGATGGAISAIGDAADIYANGGVKLDQEESIAGSAARSTGRGVAALGEGIKAGVSEESRKAMQDSAPDGDILDPSTWTLGQNPSLRGYTMLAADVLGSLLPVVATAAITKSPAAAAAVGGGIGGGGAADQAEQIILDMAGKTGPDGKSALESESAFYREQIAAGVSPDEAARRTAMAARKVSMLMTAPVSAFGGAVTGKIVGSGIGALAGAPIGARIAGTAAASALEEGAQEVSESVATKAGINAAAGADLSLTEGTFADFILGALGGGPVGAASGIPAPQTRDDGSVAGEAGTFETTPPGGGALVSAVNPNEGIPPLGLPAQEGGAAVGQMPPPPIGPLSEIAALAPDLAPQPEATPRFPDQKPGKEVRLVDPETGVIHDAVVLGETPEGISVRIAGGEVVIDPATFDAARLAAGDADTKAAGKPKKAKRAPKAVVQPSEQPAPPVTPGVDDAAAEALREQGFYDLPTDTLGGQAKAGTAPKRPADAPKTLTPEEALKRAKMVEDTAARGGWSQRLKKKHAEFMAIAGEQADAQKPGPDDVVGSGAQVAPEKQPDIKEAGQTDAGMVADGRATSPAGGGRDQAGVVPDGGAASESSAVVPTRAPVAPITTPPDARIQPDMLGGNDTTETAMATKERRRKEWGRFLAIVEGGKSSDDSTLEGRDILVRGRRVIIRAKIGAASDLDYRLDTEGMSRDEVSSAVRGALQELDRRAPLPAPPPQVSVAPVQAPAAVSPPQAAGATDAPATQESEPTEVDSVILKAGTLDRGRVNLSKWPEGWKATYDYHIQGLTSGTGGVNGFFPTKEAAIAAGKKVIADGLRSIAEDRGGSSATPAHIAKAKKIVKWAAGDVETGTNGTTPGQVTDIPATTGLLSVLSPEKQARAAELAKKLADKARNQVSSGLDPEYITLGGELVKLYLEAGVKKFGQMLRDFAEQTGLTLKQAQEPMRAAYNHVRDNMDLEGLSIDGMDDGAEVLEEARAAIRGDAPPPSPTSPDPAPTTNDKVVEPSPDEEARRKRVADHEAWTKRRDHAQANLVVNRVLPGRQAQGTPMASIEVGPDLDGGFMVSHGYSLGGQGSSIPFDGGFDTAKAAEASAVAAIRASLKKVIEKGAESGQYSDRDISDAKKISAWLGDDPADGQPKADGRPLPPVPTSTAKDAEADWDSYSIKTRGVFAGKANLDAATTGKKRWYELTDVEKSAIATAFLAIDNPPLNADSQAMWRDVIAQTSNPAPTRAEVDAAAAETNPTPTPAQAEAENYKTGKIDWHGLTLSIENAKGSIRRKVTPDGKTAWEVKMPADYGRILGTTGADGDHVDFYMGPYPQEEMVYVIDQRDAETGEFDEHKVMLGFKNQKAAVNTYFAGFSDGKGPQRMMAVTPMGAVSVALRLQNNPEAWKGSLSGQIEAVKPKAQPAAKKSDGGADRPMDLEKLRAADFDAFDDKTREDGQGSPAKRMGRDETGRWARALVKVLKDNGFTTDMMDVRNGKDKPYREVDFGYGMSSEFDETSVHLKAPNGLHFYLKIGNGWNRGEVFNLLVQFTGEPPKPGYSRPFIGGNAFLREDMTPQKAAEEVILMAERRGGQTGKPAPTAENINAAMLDAAKASGKPTQAAAAPAEPPAGPEKPSSEKTWGDFDESSLTDPKMPNGYTLDTIRRMTRQEAKAEGYQWPAMKAVVRRDKPYTYKVESYISEKSRSDAVAQALRQAQKGAVDPASVSVEAPTADQDTSLAAWDNIGRDLPDGYTVEARSTANYWANEIETIEAGQKPSFTVRKGENPLDTAEKNFRAASEAFNDTIGAVQDIWGDKGANAFRKEASDRAIKSPRPSPEPEKPATLPSPPAKGKPDEQLGDQGSNQGFMDFGKSGGANDAAGSGKAGLQGNGGGEGDQNGTGENAGTEPPGGVERDPGRVSDSTAEPRVGDAPPNFTITDTFALGEGTDGQKLEGNLAALRLVKTLEAENRYATPEEQATLARWVGWGGLKTVFDEKHAGTTSQWGRAQAELKSILTRTEYFDAMRSTADAHYTSRVVVDAMWQAMRNFGFTGGRALEPTIGSGNFLGLQPADMSLKTEWFASEIDSMTGRVVKHLYPRATVFDGMGFQDAPFRRATFDIAIGNPPFGGDSSRVGNAKMHPDLGRMKVHNFVIAKTGQLLREGGIMGMVVTHRFLDAMDAEARDVIAPNYHFLGAVRLPNTAFKANAGTEVTTDIVFFQKRRAGDEAGDTSWLDVGAPGPNGTTMNAWFAANPDMILGRAAMDGTMYAGGRKGEGAFTVHDDGRDLAEALAEAMGKIKASLPSREQALEDAVTAPKTVSTLGYGEMVLTADNRVFRGDVSEDGAANIEEITAETFWRDNAAAQFDLVEALRPFAEGKRDLGIEASQKARNAAVTLGLMDLAGDPVSVTTKFEQEMADAIPSLLFGTATKAQRDAYAAYAKRVESKRLGSDGFDRLKSILDLRGRVKALIRAERNDEPPMEQIRGGLRQAYQAFRNTFGFLNNSKNEAILQGDVGPEMALEVKYKAANREGRAESAEEAPILSKRVIFPHKLPENMDSVADAMHISMQERGYVDPALIADLTNTPMSEVIAELTGGDTPMAFKNPATSKFEPAEVYLSGNLAEKIERAKTARAFDHIPHLKAALPAPKTQDQITASIRSMWIPRDVFEEFLRALGYQSAKVSIMEKVGMVGVDFAGDGSTEFGQQFKTDRASPGQIFEHAIKGKIPVIYDTIRENGNEKRIKNEEATKDAVAAYERMSAEFPNWAYANPMRAAKIIDAFNEKVNVVTPRKYEGTRYLRTVGTSPLVQLRNSQKNGAWRMVQDRMVLLHHVVGAGKTMTGITGVMERKRMGLTRKAVVVVPNHLTGQWGKEWLELYPAANILVPTEKDFDPANRSKLINRIATGDFDAVIIGHSQLVKIDNDPEMVTKYIEDEMDALNDAMQEQKRSGVSKRTVSQMGARIRKLRERLEAMNKKIDERRGSGMMSWKELGVDYMVLDESQEFKNLEYSTSATQLVGMNDPSGSQKAFDLLMKIRVLQDIQNGGVTFMTGTPISNSLVEIYSVMKYLIPESMDSMGIKHFDAWKSAFIQDESRFEYTASMQLKERNVMSGMVNLGPLAELYRSFADIVMRPDVERMYREQMEAQNAANPAKQVSTRFPTPKVKGGKRRILLAAPTPRMEEFTRYLVTRMAGIKNAPDKKKYASVDNPLWVLTDARKASVDIRTIDPAMGREEGSKVTRSSAEVFRIWEANSARLGTQLVFCDMSTPSKNAEKDAKAVLKAAYGKIGLKKEALAARIAKDEGRTFAARWADLFGEIEALASSPDTSDTARDSLNAWMASPDIQDASAAMFTADTGFSFYDDMKAMLVEKGIPEAEIAFIHDYNTPLRKTELFEAVNAGKIRVLIGSTMKMGAGTNAQRRLVGLHHIDAPWRPSDMEQREGRIIRQGNLFYEQDPEGFEVEILAYSTQKTSDVVQWQVLERKAKAIETFLGAAADNLQEEGGDADQYAEFMAQSTGKKVFLQKMQVEKDLIKARGAISSALRSRAEAGRFIENYDAEQEYFRSRSTAYAGVTTDIFPAGASDYLAGYRGEVEAYRAERDRIEAENDQIRIRNVGKPRKEWEKLLDNPNAPKRWTTRPTNEWEAKVYDALQRGHDRPTAGPQVIRLSADYSIEIHTHAPGEGMVNYSVYLVPAGIKNGEIMLNEGLSVSTKDFRNSEKLLSAFDPSNITFRAEDRSKTAARRMADHAAMLPKMRDVMEKKVDESLVKELQVKLASLSAETRIEEVKYAEESAKLGANHFAEMDDKGRDLRGDDSTKALKGQFQFVNAGRNYASEWGAPAGRRRIEGTEKWGEVAYFEAEDLASGDQVIVEATKAPKEEGQTEGRWTVQNVFERADDGSMEMRDTSTGWDSVEADDPITEADIMAMTQDLNAELQRTGLAGKVNVRVVRELVSFVSGARIYGRHDHGRNGKPNLITVEARRMDEDGVHPKGVMRHEIIHALRSEPLWNRKGGIFTEAEWSALTEAARGEAGIVASVKERYPHLDKPGQVEEMVAELYRLWMDNRDTYTGIERALLKVEGFLTALANLLRGKGFVSSARVMEQIATGKIGGRGPQGPKPTGPTRKTASDRVRDALGMEMAGPAAKTNTPEFKAWFGDSKVVDADGRPLVVYHGTGADFEAFNPSRAGSSIDSGFLGAGIYMTNRPRIADYYAEVAAKYGPGGNVMPLYASLQNPFMWGQKTFGVRDLVNLGTPLPAEVHQAVIDRTGFKFEPDQEPDYSWERTLSVALTDVLKERGYDGVIASANDGSPIAEIVAFAPTQIKSVFNRGTFDPTNPNMSEMRGGALPGAIRSKFKGLIGSKHWKNPGELMSNVLTDAMAGKNGYNALALVPGRALFAELGKRLASAKVYLRLKEEMDSLRNDWHSKADEVAQEWRKARAADPSANDDLMDLMHRSTLSGVDPSKPDTWKHAFGAAANEQISRYGDNAPKWAFDVIGQVAAHEKAYAVLQEKFAALPKPMQDIYRKVRANYDRLGDDFEKAVLDNIETSMKVAIKRAERAYKKEMSRITDEGLSGDEKDIAMAEAKDKLDAVKKRGGWGAKAKISALRKRFEGNRLKGPYFPLARFGQFFVTVRNRKGEVVSFSRFEKEAQQQTFIRETKADGVSIQFGVMSDAAKLKSQVDPSFVADIEGMLADSGASDAVMDAIWQRWLETLPDQSIRTAKIHRKGREGWNSDAFRAFGNHMFHGAHQLARLKYGLPLEEALNDAQDEAKVSIDPNRSGLIVNEMLRRHQFTMNPAGSSVVAGLSSLSFIWYLGATPAAAIANISQTTVMGPGIMAARFKSAGVTGALREIGAAAKDFAMGRGDAQKSPRITQDEHAALTEAYRRGTIDKTQAHDLASVAETGIEYNSVREAWMRKIGWMFHHTERMNREVTFLANYRLARAEGLRGEEAVDAAADTTWKIHFDYQNTSRPRFMQNDLGKVLTIFRQFTVNTLWRMFRDAHQMLRGATKEERAEARTQLVGITLSMMAHAGIRGTFGYGLVMGLLAIFMPGDEDDIEEWMQDALLMEGDGIGVAAWNFGMGAALNGVPGQIIGADLTERVGSPNLWFRGPSRDLEGEDVVMHYVTELLGPPLGIALGIGRGVQMVADGEVYRGAEAMVPKVIRDILKTGRYAADGVETMNGDDLLENVNPWQLLLQANGFTPAAVAERYDINSRLKNKEREITDERKGLHKAATDALRDGKAIPDSVMDDIRDFNSRFPEYPITGETIKQSLAGRLRASQRNEDGVSLNPKINNRLRDELAPAIYN